MSTTRTSGENGTVPDWPEGWDEPASESDKDRWRSITIGERAAGNTIATNSKPRPVKQPVWEKGKVYEDRPGGFRVPMVHASNGTPVTVKQYQNNRGGFDQQRKRLKSDPNIFKKD